MAIHGGGIEPGTTEIAEAVAGDRHTFYTFSGLKPQGNFQLHLSSRKFDEPNGAGIAANARTVITIHGCRDRKAVTYVGGRHHQLKEEIKRRLAAAGFAAADTQRFPGVNPKNICNRNQMGMGVQLEISMGVRAILFDNVVRRFRHRTTGLFSAYVKAIQHGINMFCLTRHHGHEANIHDFFLPDDPD
jgi:phage replication-related protein YjqB (UPF0714/DUF867 family)